MRMQWLKAHFFLLLIYFILISGAVGYVLNARKYWGIEQWPSVSATVIRETGDMYRGYGSRSMSWDTLGVEFDYAVDGKSYKGTECSANGGGLAGAAFVKEWRAYYNPSDPQVAVLNPVPYKGMGWLACVFVTGIMAAIHLLCSVADFWERTTKNGE